MSLRGLSDLLVAIMAAGDVEALDARDSRLAHRAITTLAQRGAPEALAVLARFAVAVTTTPDPEVGLRVAGLTRATWQAVADGLLEPHEEGHRAWYTVPDDARRSLRRQLSRWSPLEAEALYRVGADWAIASTRRKYRARAGRSGSSLSLSLA